MRECLRGRGWRGRRKKRGWMRAIKDILYTDHRPFLIQSDSASRKRPFSTRLFFGWILAVLLLMVSQVDFAVFVLFLDRGGWCKGVLLLLYGTRKSVGIFARSSRATRASRATNLRPSRLVALRLGESRQSYVRGVAPSREPQSYSRRSRC